PQTELAQAGRIGDVPAALERDELCCDGGVSALVHGLAHFADAQAETRLNRIQQAGFADAGRAGEHALTAAQSLAQLVDARAIRHAREAERVARRGVRSKTSGQLRTLDEVDLVDD